MGQQKFYTTQLQAGLGLIDETRLLLTLYEPGIEPQALLTQALNSGSFARITARRLRNIVVECFAPRYMRDAGVADALKHLAPELARAELLQLLLIYTC